MKLRARAKHPAGRTLDSSHRRTGLKIEEILERLKIRPGNVIADIGAGSGLFSLPLAQAVSPGGAVYAVEIEQGLLEHISKKAAHLQITNVRMVLGKFSDPNLPATNVGLAFMHDVLHHIEDREGYLKSLERYNEPSGRIAIIDFYPELGPHKNDPALQVTKAQADAWMAVIGFKPIADYDLFKDKWFVVYSRRNGQP